MIYEAIFQTRPPNWGLRGDPFLWDALGWDVSRIWNKNQLTNADEFVDVMHQRIRVLVGSDFPRTEIEEPINWLPSGGMSGGQICAETWQSTLLPELHKRVERACEKGFSDVDYHPAEHRFRYAAWCASTAARSSRRTCSFSVEKGAKLLRETIVGYLALGPHWLPIPQHFDEVHEIWRRDLQEHARFLGIEGFSHGVAAKLINTFLKTLFLNQAPDAHFEPYDDLRTETAYSNRIQALHPPIDRLLLDNLTKEDVGGLRREWRQLHKKGWSNFCSTDYQTAINLIKKVTRDRPWTIEAYWPGYQ